MNKPVTAAAGTKVPANMAPEEWQARVDLAAVYRLVAHYGWDDVIYNHASMRVPGEPRMFLIKQHELLYTEVTASNLVKVSMDQDLDEKAGVNRPGFTLHSGVLRARPNGNCALHLHTKAAMCTAGRKQGCRMSSRRPVRSSSRGANNRKKGTPEDSANANGMARTSERTRR